MRRRFVVGALVTLLACGQANAAKQEGLRPELSPELSELRPVNDTGGDQLVSVEAGNCPVNEFDIPGEGLHAQGGIGGLAVAPYPIGSAPGAVAPVGNWVASVAASTFEVPTALLIVDDFNGEGVNVPGVYFLDQNKDLAPSEKVTLRDLPNSLLPDLHNRIEQQERALDDLEAKRQLSHGALVLNHTLSLLHALDTNMVLDTLPVEEPAQSAPFAFEPFHAASAEFPNLNVVVVAVDTEDFNTEVIAGRIAATLQLLSATEPEGRGIERFAVNLSFGLVPCSVRDDFQAGKEQSPTFEAYQEAVATANGLNAASFRQELASLLTTPVDFDPLRLLALEFFRQPEFVYLAAAGNYKLDYSLYPGYWPEFVSVSAENLSGPIGRKDPEYSDTGEVLLWGGYYQLVSYDPNLNTWQAYPGISVAGTSFAAPVMSVFAALDFTQASPRCTTTPGGTSPLSFFDTDPPASFPLPALNVPLEEAVAHYCP